MEKRNLCTDACMMRRFILNSLQMPLAIKPAQASRRTVDANRNYYDWSNRGNYRTGGLRIPLFNVYRFCQGVMCYRSVCRNVCTKGRDPQADRRRTKLAKR